MNRRIKTAAGYEFEEIPALDAPNSGPKAKTKTLWVEKKPKDDFLRFPDEDNYESGFPFGEIAEFARTGIAQHMIMKSGLLELNRIELGYPECLTGCSARQLNLLGDDNWFGECFQVLSAHGWLGPNGQANDELVNQVAEVVGRQFIEEAKAKHGSDWRCLILEVAATHFLPPLTRLWYAANLMSLYYIHYDDIAFGYLWAEYNIRLRHEADAIRGVKTKASAGKGARARNSDFAPKRTEVLVEVQRLIDAGHSVSRASELAYSNGVGASAEANRKLYYRTRRRE